MSVIINPNKILKILLSIIAVLVVLSVSSHIYEVNTGNHRYLANMFNLDWEVNFPTWFSSMILLISSILLFIISVFKIQIKDKYRFHWLFLSSIFFILSLDEILVLHEQTITPLRNLFHASGIFFFAWVIVALILLPILGIFFLRFILDLPEKIKSLFIFSAILFVSGALGMELVNGYIFDTFGRDNYLYVLMTDFEETLELTGVALFIYSLLKYIEIEIYKINFIVNSSNISDSEKILAKKENKSIEIIKID